MVSLILSEVFNVIEVLVGVIQASVIWVTSPSFVRALKVAEKVQILWEFFRRDIVLVLSPLLLYFLIEGVLFTSAAYLLRQWHAVIDPAF
jgi:hypothetical protein